MSRIEKLLTFLQQSPGDAFLQHALALEFLKADDSVKAEAYFRANMDDHPEYVATYYHLGKLLESKGDTVAALAVYERGMEVAKAAQDMHALGELRGAWDNLYE